MARVHCPDCEMAVVVDPNGVCPEGHLIGNAGRRIELAIGDDTPHPDEPQPWSAVIEAAEAIEPDAEAAAPRAIRPISIAGEDDEGEDEQENEDLMRELHALSDLDARTEERAATGPVAAETAPAAHDQGAVADEADEPEVYRSPVGEDPPVAAPTGEAHSDLPVADGAEERPRRSDEDLEAIAELAALFDGPPAKTETHDDDVPQPPAAVPDPAEGPTGSGDGSDDDHLASVSHLPYVDATQGGGAPATPERDSTRASGEAFDWSHFTAKGKRRRFGR